MKAFLSLEAEKQYDGSAFIREDTDVRIFFRADDEMHWALVSLKFVATGLAFRGARQWSDCSLIRSRYSKYITNIVVRHKSSPPSSVAGTLFATLGPSRTNSSA